MRSRLSSWRGRSDPVVGTACPTLALAIGGDLRIDEVGVPGEPLRVVDLAACARDGDSTSIEDAARLLSRSLGVNIGISEATPPAALRPLLEALTCTLVQAKVDEAQSPFLVAVDDLDRALAGLRHAVARCPQASVTIAALLRQTATLDPYDGLAAEAAAYSTLLGGNEFRRWLSRRPRPRSARTTDRPTIRIQRAGERLSVALHRPERRNALDARMRQELYEALLLPYLDDGIAEVKLSGDGMSFCSGGDLDEFGTATDLAAAFLVRLDRAPWRLLEGIRHRVHAHVHGATIGAGIELAAFASRVSAAPDAFFELPEIGMGLVPGAGGTVSIPRRIGRWRAAWLMVTGTRIDAATAHLWGLVDAVECDR